MSKPEILLTLPIYEPVLADLEREFTVHKLWLAGDADAFVRTVGGGVRALVTTGIKGARRELIDGLPKL